MFSARVDYCDSLVCRAPVAVEGGTYILESIRAVIPGLHAVESKTSQNEVQRVEVETEAAVSAAICTAVGHVAVGFVVDYFALEQRADASIGEVANLLGA